MSAPTDDTRTSPTRDAAPPRPRAVVPPEVTDRPLAIVGMAGRFPGAGDVEEFWRNLAGGVESIVDLSEDDLVAEGVGPDTFSHPDYVSRASLLDDIDLFDAPFFNISAREAALLDPQQRLFVQTAWHALENAGHGPGTDPDVGVFAGANMPGYLMSNLLGGGRVVTSSAVFELQIHNDKDYLASRTAFLLGLTGPAVSVQTACSSSLVAVHHAARALLGGECSTAIAGGVCVRVPHRIGYRYERGMIYSSDGRCRPFDARGDGTVFGNGVGAVVLRRLDDALADGDEVLAVIRASTVNNDGADKVGYTAPSISGQQRLIAATLDAAGFDPATITAWEAHGTATQVGDPIEIHAAARAFAAHTDRTGFCALSSVKSNIGHLESAAGVASLIKAVQQLRHGRLAPNLHFSEPNPRIDFDRTPFRVVTEAETWSGPGPDGDAPRRIGVSNFGIGGTNAHLVLEQAPAAPPPAAAVREPQVLVLSARSATALDAAAEALAEQLGDPEARAATAPLVDVAASVQRGRAAMPYRRAVVARDAPEAAALLGGADPGRVASALAPPDPPRTIFLFPGQGAQYPGMGRGLYAAEPVFRAEVDRCATLLEPLLGTDLRAALYPGDEVDPERAADTLRDTGLAQPALLVTAYALARQLASWGVEPDAMVGHSIGEFVAAVLSGVMTLEDALGLVARRGTMMRGLPGGSMLSVAADEATLRDRLPDDVSVAAVNAPGLCVVSGPTPAVDAFAERLRAEDVAVRGLHTSHAFHSAMIDPIVGPFGAAVREVALNAPGAPFASTVTGTWAGPEQTTDPEYWGTHMRLPVRFGAAVRTAVEDGGGSGRPATLLEVGPGNTLATLSRQALAGVDGVPAVTALPCMRRPDAEQGDQEALLAAFAGLWLAGTPVDWARLERARRRVPLPGYPFRGRRYWVAPRGGTADGEIVVETPAPGVEDEGAGGRPETLRTGYTAPRTDTERVLCALWEDFVGVSPVGVYDSFFELGGHSLMATQILNRMATEHGRTATPAELLANPTVASLAELVADRAREATDEPGLPEIVPAPEQRHEPFGLTEMQQAQWIGRLGSFDMGGVAPHLYLEFDSHDLDLARLESAWRRVVARHEMLRIVVLPDGRQRILRDVPAYRFERLDLRDLDPATGDAELDAIARRMATEVRPADTWPLWEVRATRLRDGTLRMHVSFDLLCADVASFFYQVLPAWRDFYAEPDRPATPPELSFRDYVLAEEAIQETALYERSLAYWRERVAVLPPAPELPTAPARTDGDDSGFVRRHHRLEPKVWARMKERAGEHGVTASSMLLAAYAAAIGRFSKSQHFTLNYTAVNRLPLHRDVEDMVGEFASFELLEVDARTPGSFAELARQVQRQSWADFEHRHVSGVRILRELRRAGRDTAVTMPVVFTSSLSGAQDPEGTPSPVSWLGEQADFISQTPQVSIDHFVLEFGGALELAWHAVDGLFPDGLMADVFGSYCALLDTLGEPEGWTGAPTVPLPPWQTAGRDRVNATEGPVPGGRIVDAVLASGADPHRAGRVAVVAPDATLTHGELAARAVALAGTLTDRGLVRGSVVGIGVAKGWRQIVAAVAVAAAGATYVPIDPDLPAGRRAWLVEHAGVECVLLARDSEGPDGPAPPGVATVVIDEDAPAGAVDVAGWRCPAREDDIAYVIYTSGSTGTPKGVAVTHTAALNTLVDVTERFGVTAEDRVLGLSSLSFDLSVFDVFGVLGAGGALVLPEPGAGRDPARWTALVGEHGVTVWNTVPALFEMLVTHLEAEPVPASLPLRLVMLSGDWIPITLPDRARARLGPLELISLGGATEAAVWSIHHPIDEVAPQWTSIPYGTPLRNQTFHVLNERGDAAPVWTTGELYIGGVGLASCYWNDETRTAESFVTPPGTGQRLYRTGDLGRYLPDSSIEFLGREDFQVKIGGFRIELGELEHALAEHPGVATAVASAIGPRTQQRLVAHVVPTGDRAGGEDGGDADAELVASVRAHLTATLPGYLMPADLVVLDALPLSANGKVDRGALPDPVRAGEAGAQVAVSDRLRGTVETVLALAREVLGVTEVGAGDNFFTLGGDSIMGIRFVGRAGAEGLPISPQDLFESDTFADLARRTADAAASRDDGRADAPVVPLSAHQAELLAAGAVTAMVVDLDVVLDPLRAERALAAVVARHTGLRLRVTGGPATDGAEVAGMQDTGVAGELERLDLAVLPEPARDAALTAALAELAEEIRPAEGRVATLVHVATGGDGDRLLWLAATALVDDRSVRTALEEFSIAYAELGDADTVRWNDRPACVLEWTREHGPPPAAGPAASPAGTGGTPRTVSEAGLDARAVADLRDSAFASHHLDPGEAVAAALVVAVARAHGNDGPTVVLERSVRDAAAAGAIGRFTELVAVRPAGSGAAADLTRPEAALDAVKRTRRPDGATAGPGADERRIRLREVVTDDRGTGVAGPVPVSSLPAPVAAAGTVPGLLAEVTAVLRGGPAGELALRWHDTGPVSPGTAGAVAEAFADAADAVTRYCRSADAARYDPSDFPLSGLDAGELDAFLGSLGPPGRDLAAPDPTDPASRKDQA